jgi:hypothetical protein
MKNVFFICLLFIVSINTTVLFGQEQIHVKVLDLKNNEPVRYAYIFSVDKNYQILADSNGFADLSLKTLADKEIKEITITSLGYNDLVISLNKVDSASKPNNNLILYLEPITFELEEVAICPNAKKIKYFLIGKRNNKDNGSATFCVETEIATLILNERSSKLKIKDLGFFVKHIGCNPSIRINFYENKNGEPGKDIFRKSLMINSNGIIEGWNIIDVAENNLYLPKEGFFMAIQWFPCTKTLRDFDNEDCTSVGLIYTHSEKIKYSRFSKDKWKNMTLKNNFSALKISLKLEK